MKKLIVGIVVPLTAIVGLWVGLSGGTAGAKTVKHQNRPSAVNVSTRATSSDTDTIESGDQTSPDGSAARESSSSTSTSHEKAGSQKSSGDGEGDGEGENQGGNDGPGGHEDPPGNVNHECTGDCQE